jgi:hypothetical protein
MPAYPIALDRASVVVLGKFNPSIFHPAWFARFNLLPEQEAGQAKEILVTDELTKFRTDWFELQVTRTRFVAMSDDPSASVSLRDLVASTFSLLEHTHFSALGMNRELHYQVESEEQWHHFGHFLVPKKVWEQYVENPGMRSLTIEGRRSGTPEARIQHKIEPSVRFHPGVFFSMNEHYAITDDDREDMAEASKPEERRRLLTQACLNGVRARTVLEQHTDIAFGFSLEVPPQATRHG